MWATFRGDRSRLIAFPQAATLLPVPPGADRQPNGEGHPVAPSSAASGSISAASSHQFIEAGIERLGLTSHLQVFGQLPGLEDRLDLGDEGGDLRPEVGDRSQRLGGSSGTSRR